MIEFINDWEDLADDIDKLIKTIKSNRIRNPVKEDVSNVMSELKNGVLLRLGSLWKDSWEKNRGDGLLLQKHADVMKMVLQDPVSTSKKSPLDVLQSSFEGIWSVVEELKDLER
eukprot:CAMPEP_0184014462 /NCGR_PEP_ID=MMETSP0954-20121128/5675_1 /TAXON_ID=627963 /ORGANISM="Aplanochytrium sp, Strain PBS07" /LENGTH=113 /DNA_ID=CAMNT_0026294951 /DNA_START=280 /DNA_END=617 /DNA_ORIENTATION=+